MGPARAKPGNNRKTGPARAPRGAKRRAVVSLVGKKAAAAMTDAELFAFWSAAVMKVPPPLRTSFGNFTTVNSVERVTVTTSTTLNKYIWIPWTSSALAAMIVTGPVGSAPQQQLFNTVAASPPQCMRPLRLSFSLENITTLVNTSGSIRVLSYDNAVRASFLTGALINDPCTVWSSVDLALGSLIDGAPETQEYPIAALSEEHEWVSCPSSYPAYNAYYDFVPFVNSIDGTLIQSLDILRLISGDENTPFVAGAVTTSGTFGPGGLGGLPAMRGFLVELPFTTGVQTLRLCIHRQDGMRYPANSLGHSFAVCPPKMNAAKEDAFLAMAKQVAEGPSRALIKSVVDGASGAGNAINSALGNTLRAVDDAVSFASSLGASANTASQIVQAGSGVFNALTSASRVARYFPK